jgi:hypothetical protein
MNTKTLIDGSQVDSSSEAWRAECEARAVLDMPLAQRQAFFLRVEKLRGRDAAMGLKAAVGKVWTDRQARQLLPMNDAAREARLACIAVDAQGERLRRDIEARMDELISKDQAANDNTKEAAA